MHSPKLLAPLRLSTLLCSLLLSTGCASTRPIVAIPAAVPCLPQIPQSYRKHIKAAPLPGPTAGSLATALDGQTSRLDQANDRVDDTLAIVGQCDVVNAKVTAPAPRAKFLGLF